MIDEIDKKYKTFTLLVRSIRGALFTDPLNRLSGAKISYSVPTYSALQGLLNRMYTRPYFFWVIDECRVLDRIQYVPVPRVDPYKNRGKGERFMYQYLTGCRYVIKAHYEIDKLFRHNGKMEHFETINGNIRRAIRKGGGKDLYLGCRECQAFISDASDKIITGYYDDSGEIEFGEMFHSFTLPESTDPYVYANSWKASMVDGVIRFPRPSQCEHHRKLYKMDRRVSDALKEECYYGDIDESQYKPLRNYKIPKR